MKLSPGSKCRQTKFLMSSKSREIPIFMENYAATEVKKSFQTKGLLFCVARPNNVTIIKGGKNVIF
jgi:hypothetical protein